MKPSNIPPFYVGQKVEAIESHPNGLFKKGDKFTILLCKIFCCSWGVDIGIRPSTRTGRFFVHCLRCGHKSNVMKDGGALLQNASRFRPITESFQTVSFSKVVEEAICGAN